MDPNKTTYELTDGRRIEIITNRDGTHVDHYDSAGEHTMGYTEGTGVPHHKVAADVARQYEGEIVKR